jgi:pyruvate-formate lyase-activating enzyme
MLRVVGQSERPDAGAPYLRTAEAVRWGDGFYGEEVEGERAFHWMGLAARFEFAPASGERYLEFSIYGSFYDLSQVLEARAAGAEAESFALTYDWMRLSVAIPAGAEACELALDKLFPRAYYPADERELGAQLREPLLHADPRRHGHVARLHANALLNRREMLAGAARLESTPPVLGIDMYGVCNVKPPCVYCEWDWNKELEGENVDAAFDLDTLSAYGPFFDNSHQLVNCSIGEPFMMKEFDDLLEAFGEQGKVLELTTNGQILTDRNVERLVGRSIDLYVSLDSGTPETYAKLRNDRFEDILVNLKRLNRARGGRGGLPRIHLVFMPMAVNQHELEDFVKICADLEVDRMVLRPLNYSDSVNLEWERAGYTFDYQRELLPFPRLVELSAEAKALAARYGVPLGDQMNFGESQTWIESFESYPVQAPPVDVRSDATPPETESTDQTVDLPSAGAPEPEPAAAPEDSPVAAPAPVDVPAEPLPSLGAEQQPLCLEPWRSLYILRRGTMPCCYGGEPVAGFADYREAWNGPEIVEIRETLAAGRVPSYCLNSPACPIVRKHQAAGKLTWRQSALLTARRSWFAFERATDAGWLEVASRPLKKGIRFAVALGRDPRAALAGLFGRGRD